MIKANSGRSPIFELGTIATLKIPSKLRLNTKSIRLLVRVLEYKNGQYTLQCWHGRLSGRYQGGELNAVEAVIVDLLGSSIRTTPEQKDSKDVTITLAKAIAAENNRGSISNAQKAGRKAKPGPKPRKNRNRTAAITGDDDELALVAKPRAKPGPKPKHGSKRKRMEIEVDNSEPIGPRKLRKRA
jgi:hypothetical protein